MRETPKKNIHDASAARLQPLKPILRDDLAEATAPALYDLLRCRAERSAVKALVATLPDHLHGHVVEAAANRGVVPRNVVALLVEEVGFPAMCEHLGKDHAAFVARRVLPKDHAWFGNAA